MKTGIFGFVWGAGIATLFWAGERFSFNPCYLLGTLLSFLAIITLVYWVCSDED